MRLLALTAALVLVACGGDNPPPATAPTASAAPSTPLPPPAAASSAATADAPGGAPGPVKPPSDDRDPEDKKLDSGRKPAELVTFAGIGPGMKVADLAAGGGYTTEILARAVGATGTVYGQNSQGILDKFAAKPWEARLAKPINKNVVKVTREFDDPLPPEAKDLDIVMLNLFYHDTVWMKTDRAKMNANIFKALKKGGHYIVIDHSAKDGAGTKEAQTLHRIEEKTVKDEVAKAGFKLEKEGDFLRNKEDTRDWSASPSKAGEKRGTSDRFALSFVKP